MESIDRKYVIIAVNPGKRPIVGAILRAVQKAIVFIFGKDGSIHTDQDAMLFLAKDRLFRESLFDYARRCRIVLGSDSAQAIAVRLLYGRVYRYQEEHPSVTKNPDVERGREQRNLIKTGEYHGTYQAAEASGAFDEK